MTKEVTDYLLDLTGREVPLQCNFDDASSKDGVHLIAANGESINDKIKDLLIPSWEKKSNDGNVSYILSNARL